MVLWVAYVGGVVGGQTGEGGGFKNGIHVLAVVVTNMIVFTSVDASLNADDQHVLTSQLLSGLRTTLFGSRTGL